MAWRSVLLTLSLLAPTLALQIGRPARPTQRRAAVVCGIQVRIVSVGKTKEKWLNEAIEEYTKRLRPTMALEFAWVKDDNALEETWRRAVKAGESCLVLDELGEMHSSRQFSSLLFDALETGGSRASFFIGGAEGLPPALREATGPRGLLSLSRLTLSRPAQSRILESLYSRLLLWLRPLRPRLQGPATWCAW